MEEVDQLEVTLNANPNAIDHGCNELWVGIEKFEDRNEFIA